MTMEDQKVQLDDYMLCHWIGVFQNLRNMTAVFPKVRFTNCDACPSVSWTKRNPASPDEWKSW
jgi:hypothetical protein